MSESEADESSGPNTSVPPSPMRTISEEHLDIWKHKHTDTSQKQHQTSPTQQKHNVPKSHPNLPPSSHVTSSRPVIGRNVVPQINTRTMSHTRNTPPVSQTRSTPTVSQKLPLSKDEYARLRRNKIILLVILVVIVGGAITIGVAVGVGE